MTQPIPNTALQLRSLVRSSGELEVSLHSVPIPEPAADEVLVRIEATPINPSDLGLLFGAADMGTMQVSGTAERPVLTAGIPEKFMKAIGKIDEVIECHHELGQADFILKIICTDIPAYQNLMLEQVSNIEVVDTLQSMVILSTFKDSKVVPIP